MRVAYICADPGVPVFGRKGSSVHVQAIVRALRRQGVEVELFAVRFDGSTPEGLENLRVHALPHAPKGEAAARERAMLAVNDELQQALEEAGPFDLVYERYSLWSYAGMEYARATGTPGLLEVNAPLIEEQERHRELSDRAGAEEVARRAFGAATALLAVSGGVARYLEGYPVARGRVHVVPNGVDPERFAPVTPRAPDAAGVFTTGFVGTLKPWHGLDILLDAFARFHQSHADARLLIVGDGPLRVELESEIELRGLGAAVHFSGAVGSAAIPGLLRTMDVAVAPYPALADFYFSPLKVYEYMAAGLAVVASRIGQLDGLIVDEGNGLLCPPGDAGALAAAFERLHDDAALRRRLGEAARSTVLREHTWDGVAERILHLAQLEPVAA